MVRLSTPSSWHTAFFAASAVSASMRSATDSAWIRSMRPLRKARCVNSPPLAWRHPAANSAARPAFSTTGEPWQCISAQSSPV